MTNLFYQRQASSDVPQLIHNGTSYPLADWTMTSTGSRMTFVNSGESITLTLVAEQVYSNIGQARDTQQIRFWHWVMNNTPVLFDFHSEASVVTGQISQTFTTAYETVSIPADATPWSVGAPSATGLDYTCIQATIGSTYYAGLNGKFLKVNDTLASTSPQYLVTQLNSQNTTPDTSLNGRTSEEIQTAVFGYEFSGGFAGKPVDNNYAWQAGEGIEITADDGFVAFDFDPAVQAAVDSPYWIDPAPVGNGAHIDKGIFEGIHLPENVDNLYDFDYDWADGGVGRIDVSGASTGSLVRVRFDFNVIPTVANTTIEPALDWNTRDSSGNVTFQFYLTANPSFYGTGTPGQTFLVRAEMTGYFASNEDINALVRPAIKANNRCTIQPLSILTILQK